MAKTISTFILILISTFICKAQNTVLSADEIGPRIAKNLRNGYKPDSLALEKICGSGFFLAKFLVDKRGDITDISFSRDSASVITDALSVAIRSLKADTLLMSSLAISGKTIIQPVIYHLEKGCNYPKIDQSADNETKLKNVTAFFKYHQSTQHFEVPLFGMLDFGEKEFSAIDCLILKPFTIESVKDPGY
ncbi:hypothetical protein [Mucilaginibacter psychrotolerans]|uniref:TonB C-terminal domain-containing protein n=1 Tax=Mucilaginibacter psychrotolerans TaxID=1524096 RepID=A0A4Y8S4R6_9SPHI|nr:hypothetical protein [Mucilaginibacter psychrotolerans]TFF33560.1 hypothetical protein E2R66_25125 [Mucilaginibacter psychrotolerans]